MDFPRRNPVKKVVYFGSKRLYRLTGQWPSKNRTPHRVEGRPVVVIHNPKAAGSTLKAMLGVSGTTHTMPRHACTRAMWRGVFSVVAVRHPFDRFVSGYVYMVKTKRKEALWKEVGDDMHKLDPFEFLPFISQWPEKLGPQVYWACFPDKKKPRADMILRVEDSDLWLDRLRARGIDAKESSRKNVSRGVDESYEDSLGLSRRQLERLEEAVYDAYSEDYTAFGYGRVPPGWR